MLKHTPSAYDQAWFELKAKRCEPCYGRGICDDAEPGDMSFREWVCPTCNGTGFKPIEN